MAYRMHFTEERDCRDFYASSKLQKVSPLEKPHISRHSTPGFLVFLCHKLYFPDKQKNVIFMKIRNLSFGLRQKTLYFYIFAIFLLQNSCNFADENKPLGMLCLRACLLFFSQGVKFFLLKVL